MNVSIGMKAPDFTAMTTFGPIKLSDYKGHWVILFSHPVILPPSALQNLLLLRKPMTNLKL